MDDKPKRYTYGSDNITEGHGNLHNLRDVMNRDSSIWDKREILAVQKTAFTCVVLWREPIEG